MRVFVNVVVEAIVFHHEVVQGKYVEEENGTVSSGELHPFRGVLEKDDERDWKRQENQASMGSVRKERGSVEHWHVISIVA